MKLQRESVVWVLGFLGAVLAYASTDTGLIPEAYVHRVKDVSALCGFICGLLTTRRIVKEKA